MGRHKRVDNISATEEKELERIIQNTPGMTRYGNRARTSIMMPLDTARKISFLAKHGDKTVSQTVISIIESFSVLERTSSRKGNLDPLLRLGKDKSKEVKTIISQLKESVGNDYTVSIHIKKK